MKYVTERKGLTTTYKKRPSKCVTERIKVMEYLSRCAAACMRVIWGDKESETDLFSKLPKELQLEIFSCLNNKECGNASLVCKSWTNLVSAIPTFSPNIFGKTILKQVFGDSIGEIPPVPRTLAQKFRCSSCPFWEDRQIDQTQVLCYLPTGLTLNLIKEKIKLDNCDLWLIRKELSEPVKKSDSGWFFLTKLNVPGTVMASDHKINYIYQDILLRKKKYTMPPLIAVALAMLLYKRRFGVPMNQGESTNCFEMIKIQRSLFEDKVFVAFNLKAMQSCLKVSIALEIIKNRLLAIYHPQMTGGIIDLKINSGAMGFKNV